MLMYMGYDFVTNTKTNELLDLTNDMYKWVSRYPEYYLEGLIELKRTRNLLAMTNSMLKEVIPT
jgi:hypothetical protein